MHRLTHYPGYLTFHDGTLFARSLSSYSLPHDSPYDIERHLFQPRVGKQENSILSSKTKVYVTEENKIFSIPSETLLMVPPPFSFNEKQSLFLLEFGKANRVQYTAPHASYYELSLYAMDEGNREKIFDTDSTSGEFDLQPSNASLFRKIAIQEASPGSVLSYDAPDLEAIKRYVAEVNPFITELSGKKPRGVAIPIEAVVTAVHEDGIQKAAMKHYFYVDFPGKLILASGN